MSPLFQSLQIGPLTIRNRFMRSATYFGLADQAGRVGAASVELMRNLAVNQVGLIVTGYAYVNTDGQVFADQNGINSDDQIAGYQDMTRAVHEAGGHIALQIAHGGSAATIASQRNGYSKVVSLPENHQLTSSQGLIPMTDEDIEQIIDDFGTAASRAQEAGFDGVQIHGAHGYLVTQFLSPKSNHRNDRWGGSATKRQYFLQQVVRAMRRQVDDDFPIMIKLGCRDYLGDDTGMAIEEGVKIASMLEAEGVAFIEISHGMSNKSYRKLSTGKENKPIREAYLLPDAIEIRKSTSVPLAVVGGMRSLEVMENVIESGVADCISLCRPLIRQPDIIRNWSRGVRNPADCVSCFACLKTERDGTSAVYCREILKKGKSHRSVAAAKGLDSAR